MIGLDQSLRCIGDTIRSMPLVPIIARTGTGGSTSTSPGRTTLLDPCAHRPVEVLHEGGGVDGWLTAQRREPGAWWGYVRYVVGVGMA